MNFVAQKLQVLSAANARMLGALVLLSTTKFFDFSEGDWHGISRRPQNTSFDIRIRLTGDKVAVPLKLEPR